MTAIFTKKQKEEEKKERKRLGFFFLGFLAWFLT